MKRARVCLPNKCDQLPGNASFHVIRFDRDRAIDHSRFLRIPSEVGIAQGDLLESIKIPGIEIESTLDKLQSLLRLTPPAKNVASKLEDFRVVWQCLAREFEFLQGPVVIAIAVVQVLGPHEVSLACFRPQPNRSVNCSSSSRQAGRGVVET